MARRTQRRDATSGRYVHRWGVVAQDARGDIEHCAECGQYRIFGGGRIDPATIAEEAWL